MHFLDLSRHLWATAEVPQDKHERKVAAFVPGLEDTVVLALGEPMWHEATAYAPGTRAGMVLDQGYNGAHQAFLADLTATSIAWEDVPNILLFTAIPPDTNNAGITVILTPVPRVAHFRSMVDGIPPQFVIIPFTTWIWIGGTISRA